MAYEYEIDEWRSAVSSMTEMERVSGPRIVGGVYMVGEPEGEL
ncbi:hypothetical protein [Mycobacterium sp. NAZ190054]|nr:hypothetical protein [Mycobacterium sp. NAZ190054]